jgi:RNA polymerase-binding transcription factor DksA
VAKKTGKKPSAKAKPSRSVVSARSSGKKSPAVAVKHAPKSSAKSAKKSVRKGSDARAAKTVAKTVASARLAPKGKSSAIKPVVKAAKGKPQRAKPDRPGKIVAVSASKLKRAAAPLPAAAAKSKSKRPVAAAPPAPAPVVPPVNGKPRKNPAGLSSRELEHFRDMLLAKRRELIGDMSSMEREALRSSGGTNLSNLPIHMADMGTDNYEQEFTLGLVQKDRDLLKEINTALAKLQNNTYGLCDGTSQPINKERLEFQPWVRYSVEYQRKMERHGR